MKLITKNKIIPMLIDMKEELMITKTNYAISQYIELESEEAKSFIREVRDNMELEDDLILKRPEWFTKIFNLKNKGHYFYFNDIYRKESLLGDEEERVEELLQAWKEKKFYFTMSIQDENIEDIDIFVDTNI